MKAQFVRLRDYISGRCRLFSPAAIQTFSILFVFLVSTKIFQKAGNEFPCGQRGGKHSWLALRASWVRYACILAKLCSRTPWVVQTHHASNYKLPSRKIIKNPCFSPFLNTGRDLMSELAWKTSVVDPPGLLVGVCLQLRLAVLAYPADDVV